MESLKYFRLQAIPILVEMILIRYDPLVLDLGFICGFHQSQKSKVNVGFFERVVGNICLDAWVLCFGR
jgi:hypothetical protein